MGELPAQVGPGRHVDDLGGDQGLARRRVRRQRQITPLRQGRLDHPDGADGQRGAELLRAGQDQPGGRGAERQQAVLEDRGLHIVQRRRCDERPHDGLKSFGALARAALGLELLGPSQGAGRQLGDDPDLALLDIGKGLRRRPGHAQGADDPLLPIGQGQRGHRSHVGNGEVRDQPGVAGRGLAQRGQPHLACRLQDGAQRCRPVDRYVRVSLRELRLQAGRVVHARGRVRARVQDGDVGERGPARGPPLRDDRGHGVRALGPGQRVHQLIEPGRGRRLPGRLGRAAPPPQVHRAQVGQAHQVLALGRGELVLAGEHQGDDSQPASVSAQRKDRAGLLAGGGQPGQPGESPGQLSLRSQPHRAAHSRRDAQGQRQIGRAARAAIALAGGMLTRPGQLHEPVAGYRAEHRDSGTGR